MITDKSGVYFSFRPGGPWRGPYATAAEAGSNALRIDSEAKTIHVGIGHSPVEPETLVDGYDLLAAMKRKEHPDYFGVEIAEAIRWPEANRDQVSELTISMEKVIGDWMDRHGLRPDWAIIDADVEECDLVVHQIRREIVERAVDGEGNPRVAGDPGEGDRGEDERNRGTQGGAEAVAEA